jgi:YesN/AraC family two-component response regulator
MGGKIWVESEVKVGSTFYIELPRKEVLGVPKEEEMDKVEVDATILLEDEAYKDSNNGNRPTIMIVEDNYSLRDYLSTILNPYYEIIPARNGEEALNLLNDNGKPSLIISDVMMPVMDGFQLMEQLKADERYNRIPLIMLTARADIKDKLKALRIGVDDYLLKPFDEEEVLVRIGNLLENYNARKEMQVENKTPEKETPAMSQQDRQWLETFEAYIQENLSNEMINVAELARHFTMSESSLLRQLKYLTGLTPAKYLLEMRLDKARQMLEQRVYNSVHQVANEVGYQDARSFSRSFKKRFGKLPSAYLKTSEA